MRREKKSIEHKPTKSFENMTGEFENENDTHEGRKSVRQREITFFPHRSCAGSVAIHRRLKHTQLGSTLKHTTVSLAVCCEKENDKNRGENESTLKKSIERKSPKERARGISNQMVIFRFV